MFCVSHFNTPTRVHKVPLERLERMVRFINTLCRISWHGALISWLTGVSGIEIRTGPSITFNVPNCAPCGYLEMLPSSLETMTCSAGKRAISGYAVISDLAGVDSLDCYPRNSYPSTLDSDTWFASIQCFQKAFTYSMNWRIVVICATAL